MSNTTQRYEQAPTPRIWNTPGPVNPRQATRTLGAAFLLSVAISANGCTHNSSSNAAPTHTAAQQLVADHLDDLGIAVDTSECERDGTTSRTCRMITTHGVTVEIRVIDVDGSTYFETVSGLIDGATIENRLSQDYGLRLAKTVEARCPDIIQANNGDTAKCTLTATGETPRTATVKILDNRTGDYTVIATSVK